MRLVVVSNRLPFVNPSDVEGLATAIEQALSMSQEEQRDRIRAVREYDIYRWVDEFLETSISKDLADFPRREEYIPQPARTIP